MSCTLILADPAFSSWSMRAWLVVHRFGIPVTERWVTLYDEVPLEVQIDAAPARTVPVLLCDDGTCVTDSLAIAEELASRHPERALWPRDPSLRAMARSLAAEMHSGFSALRAECPMCLRTGYADVPVAESVAADLDRLATIWADALARSGGPWLAGDYSIADAFYAPVAARIAGYDLAVTEIARAYVDRHLADPAFRDWREMGLTRGGDLHDSAYARPHRRVPWPEGR
ncbi:glutathione S-transferase [Palleronia sp. LCG004]|uniref:glutathione S-transferase n=1 Tax=Palleronia sp. LCG004 TaxID=3079304 RepID=UPI0029431461|nr:glutathione S-transferase [Palleronia sp. LCG004]WOI55641.1 glutathione S-transferase [Palleronia sp. LCG004]